MRNKKRWKNNPCWIDDLNEKHDLLKKSQTYKRISSLLFDTFSNFDPASIPTTARMHECWDDDYVQYSELECQPHFLISTHCKLSKIFCIFFDQKILIFVEVIVIYFLLFLTKYYTIMIAIIKSITTSIVLIWKIRNNSTNRIIVRWMEYLFISLLKNSIIFTLQIVIKNAEMRLFLMIFLFHFWYILKYQYDHQFFLLYINRKINFFILLIHICMLSYHHFLYSACIIYIYIYK